MHDTSKFIDMYEDAVDMLYKKLRKLKFPVAKLLAWEENPNDERLWSDPTEDDYTYTVDLSVFLHKDDDESVCIQFKLYSEFLFSKIQYYELEIKVDGFKLNNQELVDEFIRLLKTKGTRHADIYAFTDKIGTRG